MAERNLVLQLLIRAKDEASAVFGRINEKITSVVNTVAAFVGVSVSMQKAVQSAADFEEQLGKVAVKGGYTAAQMTELQAGVEQIAAQFGVTGQEAAQGMEVLAAAGLSAKDAIATLPQVLALAQMEGLSLDDAATKLSDTLSIMGLGFDQAGRMADVLAKGANITTSSAASLSEALSKVGGQAKAAGLDLEQTVAALDLLHKNGIKGSEAGTGLAAILTQLLAPASAASQQLNLLGISSRDLGAVLDGLQAAGAKAGPAILAFGETAGPNLRALISEGSRGLNDFTGQLRNLDGDALKSAQALSSNFNSALKALGAAWDAVARQLAAPLLAPLTAGLKALGAALSDTSGLLGGAFLAAAALVGKSIAQLAAALPGWVASLRASAAALSVAELATVGFSRVLALLTGPVGLILAAVAGFLAFRQGAEASKAPLDALKGSVEQQAEALKKLGNAQLEVAKTALQKAIADQTVAVQRLGEEARSTADKVGQQVIVWDDWRQGAHRVTVGQEQLAEANAKVEAATQQLSALTQQYNAVTQEQAQRAAAATQAALPQAQSVGQLSKAYTQTLIEVESYRDQLQLLAPASEAAQGMALMLADAERRAAAAKEAYLAALIPARVAQQQYNQTAAEAAAVLKPYQDLVTRLRGELEQQQKAHLDTTVTAEKLKQAQVLLAQQTDAYWTSLKRLTQDERDRPGQLLALKEAYQQQEREVARLTLTQDGSRESGDALAQANNRLAQISGQYTNLAQQEGTSIEQLGQKRQAEAAATAATTQAKLAQLQAALQLQQAYGHENQAAQLAVEIARTEAQAARDVAAAKRGQAQQAAQVLEQKQREYALTLQNNPAQQAEIYQLQQMVVAKQAEADAAEAAIAQKDREVQQAAVMAGPIGQLTRLYAEQTGERERAAAASDRYYDTQLKEVQGAIQVAKARGDEAEEARLLAQQQDLLIEQAQAKAAAAQQAAADAQNTVAAYTLQAQATDGLSAAEKEQIAQLQAVADAKAAAAAQAANYAQDLQAETGAARENAAAQAAAAAAAQAAADAAAEAADKQKSLGNAVSTALSAANRAIRDLDGDTAKLNARFNELQSIMLSTTNAQGMAGWMGQIAAVTQTVTQEFESQKARLTDLTNTLARYADTGQYTATVQQAMIQSAGDLDQQYTLLNAQDLDNLRAALDSANQKLRAMQQETQDAKDRLAELNAELLEAQGADQKAQLLRQQLSFQQQLAAIEKQRAEAEAAGNRDLLAILADQEAVLRQINDAKTRNIAADTASESAGDRLARTWRGAADAVDATGTALARLNGTDLTRLHTQVTGIAEQAGKLRDAL